MEDMEMVLKLKNETPSEQFDDMRKKIRRILKYKLPIYIIETEEENEQTFLDMAEAFIRINKSGVRIGNLELMLSFLAGAMGGDLKMKVYELYEKVYDGFEIELQPVIRFTFSHFGLKQTQISKVNQFKANIEKIKKVPSSETEIIFNKCEKSLRLTLELLQEGLGIANSKVLPSQLPLVTIATYLYHRDINCLEQLEKQDLKNIINWFVLSSFNGYYSSATNTKLDEDINIVKSSSEYFPINQLIENMKKRKAKVKISENDIKNGLTMNVLRRKGRAYLFMLYILLVKKNADNWNGKLLKLTPLDRLARHHIFPKEYLEEELNIDDPDERETKINNLGNITFIYDEINSEIGDTPPIEYLEDYIDSARNHFIPTDKNLWKLNQYELFLEYRVKEIYNTGKTMFSDIFE